MTGKTVVPVQTDTAKTTTTTSRRRPATLFDAMQEEMERRWGQLWPFGPQQLRLRGTGGLENWAPRLDAYEQDGQLVVKVELPGVKKEDITVALDGDELVLHGERKQEQEVKEEDYYRLERSYGSFDRRLLLPFEAPTDQISATFNDGVLEVKIPKPAETTVEPKRIAIT